MLCVNEEGRKEMFYLTTHSTHFIYCSMASDIWQRTIQIPREETRSRHMGYTFRFVLLYAYVLASDELIIKFYHVRVLRLGKHVYFLGLVWLKK